MSSIFLSVQLHKRPDIHGSSLRLKTGQEVVLKTVLIQVIFGLANTCASFFIYCEIVLHIIVLGLSYRLYYAIYFYSTAILQHSSIKKKM